jgi:predicted amidohydrolase YtcJ
LGEKGQDQSRTVTDKPPKNPAEAPAAAGVVYKGGRVLTMEPSRPRASVMACSGGRLAYVGDDLREALASLQGEAEVVDLKGRDVVPGLIDSHVHVLGEGLRLSQLDLTGFAYKEALEAVAEEAAKRGKGTWIHGRRWDQNIWGDQGWPSKRDLDRAAPDNPVVLDRVDKHSIWVNSLALELSGVDRETAPPSGGEILRDYDGSPAGVLIGQAMFLVYDKMPLLDGQDFVATYVKGQAEALGYGLTTLVDCAVRPADFPLIEKAVAERLVKARLRLYIVADPWDEAFLGQGPRRDLHGGRLSVDGLKIFSDGSLGSRSAWLQDDYSDRAGYRGGHIYSDEALTAILAKAKRLGFQVAIHVIGDAAVAQAVSCMAAVLGPERTSLNWRLEHYQVVADADRERVLSMGLIPSIQSVGLMTDLHMAKDRLGSERLGRAYVWRDVIDRGGHVINGSDSPVESINPFMGIYAAVARKDLKGFPKEGFGPEHALSRLEALSSYTVWSARAAFAEGSLGSLAVGKMADFAILDRDILTCPERAIAGTRVIGTVVGGEMVKG